MGGIDVVVGYAANVGFVGSVFLWGACAISGTERRAGFTEVASLKDGERGSLEPLIPPSEFALCEEGRQVVIVIFYPHLHHLHRLSHFIIVFSCDIIFNKMRTNRPFWLWT